jgi:hypothetical protein
MHEDQVLSDTTIRILVRTHGQLIRQAEQAEVAALLQQPDLATMDLQLVPHDQPQRRASWPKELNGAVELALAAEQPQPPEGVRWADWERGKRGTLRRVLSSYVFFGCSTHGMWGMTSVWGWR